MNSSKSLPKSLYAFIWHFLRPYRSAVLISATLAICAGFWGPFNSILIKQIIDLLPHIQEGNTSTLLLPAGLIVINFIIFDNFTWRGIDYIRCRFFPVIINHIIAESMDHVLGKSPQFFQDNLSGKISKQITTLADGIEKLAGSVATNFLRGSALLLAAFVASYFVNPIFCVILVMWFMLFAGISIFMSKKLVSLSDAQARTESVVVGELVDSVSNHSNIRIFARKSYENLRMVPFFTEQRKAYTATNFYALIMHSIQGGLIAIMMGFSIYFLIYSLR